MSWTMVFVQTKFQDITFWTYVKSSHMYIILNLNVCIFTPIIEDKSTTSKGNHHLVSTCHNQYYGHS